MYKEVNMNEAVMAALKGSTVYVITENPDGERPYIDPIGIYKLSDLLKNERSRYILDEPENDKAACDMHPEAGTLSPATGDEPPLTTNHYGPRVDVGKINALHNAGWSTAAIADEMHISKTTVQKYTSPQFLEDAAQ